MSRSESLRSDRRGFLRQLGAGALSAAALLGGSPLQAIEPIARSGGPKFKFSLAAYSYRDFLLGKNGAAPELTFVDFLDDCVKMGLDGAELTSYYFPKDVTTEYLRSLEAACFTRGLDVSGTAVGNDFCLPPGEKRDAQIKLVKDWIERADILGAPVIRIFSGKAGKDQSPADASKLAIEAIEECCDYAGKYGVFLALENHGGLTSHVDDMLSIVKAVKSPWFGVNVDGGNFHAPTFDEIYADLAKIAPYALNVQIKVVLSTTDKKHAPADFNRLAQIFRDSGYRGYIVLEYEEKENPREACPRYIEELRKAFTTGA